MCVSAVNEHKDCCAALAPTTSDTGWLETESKKDFLFFKPGLPAASPCGAQRSAGTRTSAQANTVHHAPSNQQPFQALSASMHDVPYQRAPCGARSASLHRRPRRVPQHDHTGSKVRWDRPKPKIETLICPNTSWTGLNSEFM